MIKINIEKAKELHKNKIRNVRRPLLEQKDVEFIRALEIGDTEKVTQVTLEKQQLRDVTSIVTDAEISGTTVDEITQEIKQLWDENLLGPNPYPSKIELTSDPEPPKVTTRVRARNEDGTFKSDDPSTPDINEAWETS